MRGGLAGDHNKESTHAEIRHGNDPRNYGELYEVSDHPSDDAAVEAFRASMKEMFPELRLEPAGDFENDGCDFVVRVADDFDLSATSIRDDAIEDQVALFVTKPIDDAERETAS